MADARFYDYRGPFSLDELAKATGAILSDRADPKFLVADVFSADTPEPNGLGFLNNPFAGEGIDLSAGGAWVVSTRTAEKLGLLERQLLLHDNPAAAFAKITHLFYPLAGRNGGAGGDLAIDPSAKIGKGVVIEFGAVIGPGVEIGDGFEVAGRRGSRAHDAIVWDSEANDYRRETALAGGTEGGMSTGELLVVRAAMKPLATLNRPTLKTVDVVTKQETVSFKERTDVTAVPAMGVVAETMVALVLAAEAQRKFGGDSVREFVRNAQSFEASLRSS